LQSQKLGIDPSHPYVFAVADPDNRVVELNESNNTAFFRKYVIGAVTHGLEPDGEFPAWVQTMADVLKNQKQYDDTIPFDWADQSWIPATGYAVNAGHNLAYQLRQHAQAIANGPNFRPGDVIDLHLIGHSRGAVVIGQAIQDLQIQPLGQFSTGYVKMTMLDPHPASNLGSLPLGIAEVLNPLNFNGVSTIGRFSFDTSILVRHLALAVLRVQSRMQDPSPTVPSNVDEAESYYQNTLARDVGGEFASLKEQFINLWGRPVAGAVSHDLTNVSPGISHAGMVCWYMENVLGGPCGDDSLMAASRNLATGSVIASVFLEPMTLGPAVHALVKDTQNPSLNRAPVRLSFVTGDETPNASGNAYSATPATLTFTPGETTEAIPMAAMGGKTNKSEETFFVDLSGEISARDDILSCAAQRTSMPT